MMNVQWKAQEDQQRLMQLVAEQSNAKQRDRYRAVLIAGQGWGDKPQLHREEIASVLGRSRQFVDTWVGRYRKGGIEALLPKRQPGAKPALTQEQQQQLSAMLDRGPTAEERLSAYNGPIIREKIQELFGKTLALGSVYRILHRLGYNDLMPRGTHPDTDPAVMEDFKKTLCPSAWLSSRPSIRASGS